MPRLVFRCDAAALPEIGSGHVVRSLTLARALTGAGSVEAGELAFATRSGGDYALGGRLIAQSGFQQLPVCDDALVGEAEGPTLADAGADLVVLDQLDNAPSTFAALRRRGSRIVALDDVGPAAGEADLLVNAILQTSPADPRGRVLIGYRYLVGVDGSPHPRQRTVHRNRRSVFASFGGWDARGLARHLIAAWRRIGEEADLEIAIGEATTPTPNALRLQAHSVARRRKTRISLRVRPTDFAQRLARADVAVVSGGLTAFQAVAAGAPAIGLPQYEHQLATLRMLEANGVALIGSSDMHLSTQRLCASLRRLLTDSSARRRMARRGPRLIDGGGTRRVVSEMSEFL